MQIRLSGERSRARGSQPGGGSGSHRPAANQLPAILKFTPGRADIDVATDWASREVHIRLPNVPRC